MHDTIYKSSRSKQMLFLFIGIVCLIIAAGCLYAVLTMNLPPRAKGQAITLALIALAMSIPLIYFGVRPSKIVVKTNGHRIEVSDPKKTIEVAWDDVAVVAEDCVDASGGTLYPLLLNWPFGTHKSLTIQTYDGRGFTLHAFLDRFSELQETVRNHTFDRLYEDAKHFFQEEDYLDFGGAYLTSTAIRVDNSDPILFDDIDHSKSGRSGSLFYVHFVPSKKTLLKYGEAVPIAKVANLQVMTAIYEELTSAK